jgi:uncharacterized membrane protein
MCLDDWILALHVLSAFALVGALTMFSIGVVLVRRTDSPTRVVALGRVLRVGGPAIVIGIGGTLVFGVWLAISLDAYQVWDGWVLLALLGWVVASAVGGKASAEMGKLFEQAGALVGRGETGPSEELARSARTSQGPLLHWIASALTILVLLDMVWKPGA